MKNEIVLLNNEEFRDYPAELVSMGAYYSLVKFTRGGIDYEVLVSNDDIIFGENSNDDDEG